jgi:myxalamid-type nonribosomal peptide synthetase MxaA
VHHCYFIKYLR